MKRIFEFIFGKVAVQETGSSRLRIQSSYYPERVGFNQWSESVHRECRSTFLRK